MSVYMVILKDGHKFYVESFESYEKIFNRYLMRYGNNLGCVVKEYLYNSIEDIKKSRATRAPGHQATRARSRSQAPGHQATRPPGHQGTKPKPGTRPPGQQDEFCTTANREEEEIEGRGEA